MSEQNGSNLKEKFSVYYNKGIHFVKVPIIFQFSLLLQWAQLPMIAFANHCQCCTEFCHAIIKVICLHLLLMYTSVFSKFQSILKWTYLWMPSPINNGVWKLDIMILYCKHCLIFSLIDIWLLNPFLLPLQTLHIFKNNCLWPSIMAWKVKQQLGTLASLFRVLAWFQTTLLLMQLLDMNLGRQCKLTQVLGPLLPVWVTRMQLVAPDFH